MGRGARFVVVAAIALTSTLASLTVVPAVAESTGPVPSSAAGGGEAGHAASGPWNVLPFAISKTPTANSLSACFLDSPPGVTVETCSGPSQGNFGSQSIFRASEGLCGSGTNGLAARHNTAMGADHEIAVYATDPTSFHPSSLAADAVVESCANAGAGPDALDTITGASVSKDDFAIGLLRTSYVFPDGQNGRLTRYPTTTPAWPTGTFTVNPDQSFADIDNKGLWEFIGTAGRTFGGRWATPAGIDPLVVGNNDPDKSWDLMGSDLPGICDPSTDPFVDNGGNVWPWNLTRMQHCMYAVDQSSATAILFNRQDIDDPADPFARYDIEYSPRFAWAPESWRDLTTWLNGGSTEWEIKRLRPVYMVDTVFTEPGGAACIWRAGEGRLDRGGCNVDSTLRSGSMLAFDVPWFGASDPTMLPSHVYDRGAAPPVPSFSDVSLGHPFYTEIRLAAWYGWVAGYPDGTFRSTLPVTRQAAMAVLWRRAGSPAGPFDVPAFDDVPAGHPFETAIDWAVDAGVTTGYADGGFHPSAPVTRQAGVTWLWRLAGSPPGPFEGSIFSDVGAGHPFETPILWAADVAVTAGYADGTFRSLDAVTRQALVAWLIPT